MTWTTTSPPTPPVTSCEKCRDLFYGSHMIQLEARHILAKEGASAATAFVNDLYEEEHWSH